MTSQQHAILQKAKTLISPLLAWLFLTLTLAFSAALGATFAHMYGYWIVLGIIGGVILWLICLAYGVIVYDRLNPQPPL